MHKRKTPGFTLVEVIVVLVILAILSALLIPALTGYIDKARDTAAVSECRQCVMAAQSTLSKKYALDSADTLTVDGDGEAVLKLAELDGSLYEEFETENGKVMHLYYQTAAGIQVAYCAEGGCLDCGNAQMYALAGSAGAAPTKLQKEQAAYASFFTEFKEKFDSLSIGKQLDSTSTSDPAYIELMSGMSEADKAILNEHTWCFYKDSTNRWRFYFTDTAYSTTQNASNVTVYKYTAESGYQRTTDGVVKNGKLTSTGMYKGASWYATLEDLKKDLGEP